jgi:hypothetical protein
MRWLGAARPRRRVVVEALVVLVGLTLVACAWKADRVWFEHHVLWRYCAVDPKELARIRVGRWCCGAVGALLIVGVRPLLGGWAARRSARAIAGLAVRVVGALVLALAVSEGILRLTWKRPPPPHPLALPESRGDARYGWVHEPSRTEILSYGAKKVTYHFDADGNRILAPDRVLDPSLPTIVVGGESTSLGLGLDYDQTFPVLLEQRLGVQTVNLSVTGYGNDQAYLRVRDELPRLAKPLAVVALVVPVQLVRNVDPFRAHRIPRDDGSLYEVSAEPTVWTDSPLRQIFAAAAGVHSDEAIRIARATFRATARDARARGAFPLFVLTHWGPPCLPDETGAPSIDRALFDDLDVEHVRADLDPAWWEAQIDHPSPRAHVAIADVIVEALRSHGVVP